MPGNELQQESLLRRRAAAGLTLAIALTAAMAYLSWRGFTVAENGASENANRYFLMNVLDNAMRHTLDVESGARGFAGTGQEQFLEPYGSGRNATRADLQKLSQLTKQDPVQQQNLDLLEPELNAAVDTADSLVEARRRTGVLPDPKLFDIGKVTVDRIRATVSEMETHEQEMLEQSIQRRALESQVVGTSWLLAVAGITALAFAAWLSINRGVLNLEARVMQRTLQLETANIELATANKELEAFTYSVSHDLRAPLRHIAGFSRIIAEEFSSTFPPQAQVYLRRIEQSTRHMGQLVDELLNLARVGRYAPSFQITGLNLIIKEIVESFKEDSIGREVEWKIDELPFVECDPVLIRQVLQNLLANALKFTRPRAKAVIQVSRTVENGQSVFAVSDNGVGFSMKYVDKLFGVFQRLHRTEDFEGTGVGLVTAQRIVQKHGGRLWAIAELDKGATFYFTLGTSEQSKAKTKTATAGSV